MPDSKLPHLLSADEVARIFKVSPRTISRTVELGTFPPPVALPGTGGNGSRRVAWRGADIQACLDSLKPVCIESPEGASNV